MGSKYEGTVMSAGSAVFCYDSNGNMTQKIDGSTTSYAYDAGNRMTAVSGAISATFVYDGDGRNLCTPVQFGGSASERGKRVKCVVGGVTTTCIGNYFELFQGRSLLFTHNPNWPSFSAASHRLPSASSVAARTVRAWMGVKLPPASKNPT